MAIYNKGGALLDRAYAVGGSELSAAYDIGGVQVFPEGTHLRICTYNVGQWYLGTKDNVPANLDEAYYALQNGMISSIDADILCLEEYWDQFSKAGRTAVSMLGQYYDYIETKNGSANDYYGRAICSKYPILSYTSHNYTVDALRYFDEAKVSIEGTDVYVFVTHLSSSSSTYRAQQATELLEFIEANNKMPYIICGDFNSNLKDPMSEYNIAVYQQYLDNGVYMIQTDRPELLISWLKAQGRHSL